MAAKLAKLTDGNAFLNYELGQPNLDYLGIILFNQSKPPRRLLLHCKPE